MSAEAARPDRSARVAGADVVNGGEVKLVPGGPADLINLSETGALVEGKTRLHVGANVKMFIEGANARTLSGRIVRCQVSAIHRDSSMTYQLGIQFDEPIAAVDAAVDSAPADAAALEPVPEMVGVLPPPPPVAVEDLVNEW